jgi:hypothetical protein
MVIVVSEFNVRRNHLDVPDRLLLRKNFATCCDALFSNIRTLLFHHSALWDDVRLELMPVPLELSVKRPAGFCLTIYSYLLGSVYTVQKRSTGFNSYLGSHLKVASQRQVGYPGLFS